ncbi:MAG: FHA domain-containing protein [Planctomycetota bacterium]|jgi:hypothetical protein|nr:FHA domain-containing protein [Planctomycetota bacterium]
MATVELAKTNGDGPRSVEILESKPLFLGRFEACDIPLRSLEVSRRHAIIIGRDGEYGLMDMNSANGTFLNGKRISKPVRLYHGDVIQIGEFSLTFREGAAEGEDMPPGGDATAIGEDANVRRDRNTSVFRSGDGEHRAGPDAACEKKPATERAVKQSGGAEPVRAENRPLEGHTKWTESGAPVPEEPPVPSSGPELEPPKMPELGLPPSLPELPSFADLRDDGEEGGDAAFLIDEAAEEPVDVGISAIEKAAAEAGLIGEFVQETEDVPAPAPAAEEPAPPEGKLGAVPVGMPMRQAIETRLQIYAFLDEMRRRRADILARNPSLPDSVKSELARQDRELDKMPTPSQADGMMEKRLAKQKDLMDRIAAARAQGETPPPKPSKAMRNAEQLAIAQWQFCSRSGREALPGAYSACFQIMRDEPLVPFLQEAGQDPLVLMGGGAYHLALETLLEETKADRQNNRAKLALLPDPAAPKKKKRAEDEEDEELPTESRGELLQIGERLAARGAWLAQEIAFMEKTLIQEFWRVYPELALVFLPKIKDMPTPVRAFLRHGAVGFKSWWMKPEVREHVLRDCAEDIVYPFAMSRSVTNVLYAEEYLAAVAEEKCTPAMDENLEINERNSPNWKADKALRKLINARNQAGLMEELVTSLSGRIEKLNEEGSAIDEKISKLLPGMKNYKQLKNEFGMQRQSLKVEATKLSNLARKISEETLAGFKEAKRDTEERFASGELPRPTTEFLIRRECEAVHKIGRLLANLKERFMPLVIRDNFAVGTDGVNDRPSIMYEFADLERRDPSVFLETIVPSKKKASRVDLRVSPAIVLLPSAGVLAYSWGPRAKPEDGRLAIPTVFIRRRIRERQLAYLLSDFRWDTSKAAAGMDLMTSDTIVAAFMAVRWDWRKRSKEGREKGLIYNEQNDRTNWRRVYETYMLSADDAGKKLFNRNYDFYERVVAKYFDPPEGVAFLRK